MYMNEYGNEFSNICLKFCKKKKKTREYCKLYKPSGYHYQYRNK